MAGISMALSGCSAFANFFNFGDAGADGAIDASVVDLENLQGTSDLSGASTCTGCSQGPCGAFLQECNADLACISLLTCYAGCNGDPDFVDCQQSCLSQNPDNVGVELISCVGSACPGVCFL